MFVSCSGFSRFLKVQMKSSGILTELEQYHTAAHCSQVTGTKGTIPILPSYCCQAPHIWCSLAWQTQGRILGSQNSPHLFEQMPLGCDTFMWTKCRAQTAACKRGKKSKFSPKDKKALGGSMKERQTKMKTTCKCFAASGTSCSSSKSAHKADLRLRPLPNPAVYQQDGPRTGLPAWGSLQPLSPESTAGLQIGNYKGCAVRLSSTAAK